MEVEQLSWWGLGSCNFGHDGSSAVGLAGLGSCNSGRDGGSVVALVGGQVLATLGMMVVAQLRWRGSGSCNSGHDGGSAVACFCCMEVPKWMRRRSLAIFLSRRL